MKVSIVCLLSSVSSKRVVVTPSTTHGVSQGTEGGDLNFQRKTFVGSETDFKKRPVCSVRLSTGCSD